MTNQAPHELDVSVREAVLELESMNFTSPEIFLLLGTGADDLAQMLETPAEISLSQLSTCPPAWQSGTLCAGHIHGVRVWALTDAPDPDPAYWARAWPIWLARVAGAGSCLVTAAGSALTAQEGTKTQEGHFFVADHISLDGSSALRGLGHSNLGPLFPDQGMVHNAALRSELIKEAMRRGLPCAEGVVACTPGPALETPAEREYFARAGAHATSQDLGAVFHAMAHSGLYGLTLITLIGNPGDTVEDLMDHSTRLAPDLLELIESAIDPLADRSRLEKEEEL